MEKLKTGEKLEAIRAITRRTDEVNSKGEIIKKLSTADVLTIGYTDANGKRWQVTVKPTMLTAVFNVMLLEVAASRKELIEEANNLIKS